MMTDDTAKVFCFKSNAEYESFLSASTESTETTNYLLLYFQLFCLENHESCSREVNASISDGDFLAYQSRHLSAFLPQHLR